MPRSHKPHFCSVPVPVQYVCVRVSLETKMLLYQELNIAAHDFPEGKSIYDGWQSFFSAAPLQLRASRVTLILEAFAVGLYMVNPLPPSPSSPLGLKSLPKRPSNTQSLS